MVDDASFGEALEATNRELEPKGLYVFDREQLDATVVLDAARTALVPEVLRETWRAALPRLEAVLRR